jgi:hypothetical protein
MVNKFIFIQTPTSETTAGVIRKTVRGDAGGVPVVTCEDPPAVEGGKRQRRRSRRKVAAAAESGGGGGGGGFPGHVRVLSRGFPGHVALSLSPR